MKTISVRTREGFTYLIPNVTSTVYFLNGSIYEVTEADGTKTAFPLHNVIRIEETTDK